MRAIRGAIQVEGNTARAIEEGARRLAENIARENGLTPDDVVSAFFTATPDLDAQFPAAGARQAGWSGVALLCAQEMAVPGALPRCVRVLVHAYVDEERPVRHVYLEGARVLRPDWARPDGYDAVSDGGQEGL
ncbi:MAG: chorismate mutase [Limnochordaceae bacterium]|nr:chorismate mutase [Limnochordaceae bacterium]